MLHKWCEITSCNGVIDVYEAKNSTCKFWFWLMVMISMLICTIWFTYRTIVGYIETPFVTNVGTVIGSALLLPDVLVCYNGGLNVEAMTLANLSEPLIQDLTRAMSLTPCEFNSVNLSKAEFDKYIAKKKISVKSFFDKFTYNCSDFVEHFHTEGNYSVSCNTSFKIYSNKGACHLFTNSGYQSYPAYDDGLQIVLKQPKNSFYALYPQQALEIYMFNGFSISLEKTFGLQQSGRSLQIPLNVRADIVLNPKRYIRFCTKSHECESSPKVYHSNTCYYRCYEEEIGRICNCSSIDYWDDNLSASKQMCNPFNLFDRSGGANYTLIRQCQSRCLPICDEWIYETTVTYTTIELAVLPEPKSFLNVYYNTMQYTKVS